MTMMMMKFGPEKDYRMRIQCESSWCVFFVELWGRWIKDYEMEGIKYYSWEGNKKYIRMLTAILHGKISL